MRRGVRLSRPSRAKGSEPHLQGNRQSCLGCAENPLVQVKWIGMVPLEIHPHVREVPRQQRLKVTAGPFTKVVWVTAEPARSEIRIRRRDKREICPAHVHQELLWVRNMLDPLEADRDVKISEVKRPVDSSNFELRPDVVPLGRSDRVGGYVDASHTDGARRQEKV